MGTGRKRAQKYKPGSLAGHRLLGGNAPVFIGTDGDLHAHDSCPALINPMPVYQHQFPERFDELMETSACPLCMGEK